MPFANPSPKLSFASFVSQFPSTDQSFEPTLFRLGHALFDTIDFRLDQIPDIAARQRIADIRRKTELSKWLKTAVSSAMEADLRCDLDARWETPGDVAERARDAALDAHGWREQADAITEALFSP